MDQDEGDLTPDNTRTATLAVPLMKRAQAPANEDRGPIQYVGTEVLDWDPAHLERHRIFAMAKDHPATWAVDVLRTKVLRKMDQNGWRTVAVTSPNVASGKTVVAINLAISIAHQSQRTAMLVDFDLRRPMVARYLGLERACTLNDVLQGDAEVAQALVNPGMPHLVVLPTDRPVPRSAEVLTSTRSRRLVQELRDRYPDRVVIFDLPPVLAVDDVLAVLPSIDCVLMVVGSGVSSRREIADAMRQIDGAQLLGVVVNKDETPTRRRYGYY